MYYRPVREKEMTLIKEQTEQGVLCTGWRDVGLLSLSTADYSRFTPLLDSMNTIKARHHLKMSIPSTRIDALSGKQLDALNSVSPVTSFTIAPEAASLRLRKVINKDFSDEAVFQTVELLLSRNLTTLKLYFMLGLPSECEEDVQAIIDMVKTVSSMMRARSPRSALHVSLSPFSPKASTPFQWEAMESIESVEEKGRFIKRCLRDKKNVKVSYRDGSITFLETVMARGDRRVGDLIHESWRAGARFDGWDEFFNHDLWRTSAERLGMDLTVYTGSIDTSEDLPWRAVSVGVDREFLLKERSLALQEKPTPDCKSGPCSNCGACSQSVSITLCTEQKPESQQNSAAYGRRRHTVSEKRTACHYRFIYEKRDVVRFLGHLDMVEVFRRAMTAADFPLVYSQGFNPHPRVSFGPPLPFGATGLAEAFDIETSAPLEGDPLILNRWLPNGLEVKLCIKNEKPAASLNSTITACRYRIYPPDKFTKDEMYDMLGALNARTEIIVEREKKGVLSKRDIRPAIMSASLYEDEKSAYWDVVLSLAPGASCKPSEFVSSLCPNEDFNNYSVCRAECLF
jgi:radical SAM-linked protein